jgi:hypothetical protein
MLDFNLYLPEGVGLTQLAIVPEDDNVPALIQRAVCLLACHSDDAELQINGTPAIEFAEHAVSRDATSIAQMFSGVADRLTDMLNEDEKSVESVSFSVGISEDKLNVSIDIVPKDSDDAVSAVIYSM